MYSFENSIYFWALPVVLLLVLLFYSLLSWKKRVKKSIGDEKLVNQLTRNFSKRKFKLKYILLITTVFLGILAAVNLRKENTRGNTGTNSNARGIDVIIALDVSKSMLAQDVKPTRLDQAKLLVNKLIDNLGSNRIGFVVFAGQAILQMPLTTDAGAAKMLLANLHPDLVPVQGTEIGDALNIANQALGNIDDKKHKAVILITDGEDHDNKTNAALKEVEDAGVVVYTVGIGSQEGTPIFDPAINDFVKDNNGQTVVSRLGEEQLQKIANNTKGRYFLLDNESNAAQRIAVAIDGMEKKLLESPVTGAKTYTSSFPYLIGLMLLLLVLDIFINERKRSVR